MEPQTKTVTVREIKRVFSQNISVRKLVIDDAGKKHQSLE